MRTGTIIETIVAYKLKQKILILNKGFVNFTKELFEDLFD